MIKRIEHAAIIAHNMEESIAFYERFLGFRLRVRTIHNDKEIAFLIHDGLPEFELELIRDLEPTVSYSEHGLVNHLAFVVDNMDQMIITFREKGLVFLTDEPKRGLNGRQTIRFRGPNGETLQLVEERTS